MLKFATTNLDARAAANTTAGRRAVLGSTIRAIMKTLSPTGGGVGGGRGGGLIERAVNQPRRADRDKCLRPPNAPITGCRGCFAVSFSFRAGTNVSESSGGPLPLYNLKTSFHQLPPISIYFHFSFCQSTSSCIIYPIPFQEADDALVTPPESQVSMGCNDHICFAITAQDVSIVKKRGRARRRQCAGSFTGYKAVSILHSFIRRNASELTTPPATRFFHHAS
ncbi:hypothetical protein EVAR_69357_1 [Eumeta japonica]|uniref:Uncharacterized protein n=1 Tax=Eumeta variegata TaxID=151549 RepID=A0A4C2A2X3_EUMVA|nr:hypothetical protein EVAR_69357_1 [Eumeta japonica]